MITNELYDNPYNHEIRNYEVSLWTLQDEFITVLKWSDVEHKGTIQDPKLTLSDDATESFSFTIPMYFYERGELKENPIWYTTRNGNLMVNLRKIKIIFNKLKDTERVFEFLITKVTEEHEQDHLFCNVECEGLAFHELGKIGYTEALSAADFELDYKNWQEKGYWTKRDGTRVTTKPIQNVQYWCNARLGLEHIPLNADADIDPRKWYYDIIMQWDSFEKGGVIEIDGNNQIVMRDSGKVYEESFVTRWNYDVTTNKLLPNGIEEYREKERIVEASESNLYNITQTIAETFGIFCKYIYTHDSNYHISGRKIVFFNNFLHDEDIMSLTYPYASQKITREMDSTDVVTKLYVKSVENQSTLLGEDSIRYCEANQMKDDYIFNFDYLKETNSITDEQYAAVDEYIRNIHCINDELIPLQNKLTVYQNQKVELEAKITAYTNSAALAQEQIDSNQDYITSLLADHGTDGKYINTFDNSHPDTGIIIEDEKGAYYINLNTKQKGIRADSMRIYSSYPIKAADEITSFSFSYDEYGNPNRIYGVSPTKNSAQVYLTYLYEPRLYYDAIIAYFEEKLANDINKRTQAEIELGPLSADDINFNFNDVYSYYANKLFLVHKHYDTATPEEIDAVKTAAYTNGLNKKIQDTEDYIELKLVEKDQTIKEFNYMMGPALREGNWTPENYQDYGERYEATKEFPMTFTEALITQNTDNDFSLIWDNKLFDEEQDIYYEVGINQEQKVYPCVNLSRIPPNHYFWSHMQDYSFIFNSHYYEPDADTTNIKNIKSFKIGSEAILGFITSKNVATTNDNNLVYPVLILIGAKTMTDTATNFDNQERMIGGTIGFMIDPARGNPRLAIIETEIENKNVRANIDTNPAHLISLSATYWTFGDSNFGADVCQAVYPRIKFSSLMLKYQDDQFFIHKNNNLLTNYEDYYILNRNLGEGTYAPEFYITIKPYAFLHNSIFQLNNTMRVAYTLSNAGTAIYLDAIEIEKENAYPKVSYTVDPNILNKDIISTLYDKLNWLVMINDSQLKLNNTFGYISKLELELDFPDKDSIEIKNYKSKFEDLFSSIVASTESIKSNENMLASLSAGTYNISSASLAQTLENNSAIIQNYLNNYFTTSEVVQETLKDLFLTAGEILVDSNQTLNQIQTLTIENSSILGSFAQKIKEDYNPTIFRQSATPMTFKRGDTWIQINESGKEEATYTALCDSSMASNGYGWNRVHDGSVAQIVGKLNIDAENGQVELLGENMYITGSHSVNITGPHVNIDSFSYDNGSTYSDTGVFITAKQVGYDQQLQETFTTMSEIAVQPAEIAMFGSKITMLTGNTLETSTSAVEIDGNKGIWLGSTAGVKLFSGNIYDPQTGEVNGSNIELMPSYLLLGASNTNTTTSLKISPSMFLISAGENVTALESGTITGVSASGNISQSLTGLKITKDFFGMAITNGNNINAIIMNNNGLTLAYNLTGIANAGAASLAGASGSYVRLSGQGITISSGAELNVYANKFNITTNNTTATFGDAVWLKVKDPHSNGNGSSISISETQLRLQTNDTYIDLQSGLLDLHASNTEYIKMSSAGLQLEGRNITINGHPIWFNDRIKYHAQLPEPPDLSSYPDDDRFWIWIRPLLSTSWTVSTSTAVEGGYSNHSFVETNLSLSSGEVSRGSQYTYMISITIKGKTAINNHYNLRFTISGNGQSLSFYEASVTIDKSNPTTVNKTLVSAAQLMDLTQTTLHVVVDKMYSENSIDTTNQVSMILTAASVTITTDAATTGVFPCNVYYIKS